MGCVFWPYSHLHLCLRKNRIIGCMCWCIYVVHFKAYYYYCPTLFLMCTSAPAFTSSLTQWENPCQDTSCSAVLPSSNRSDIVFPSQTTSIISTTLNENACVYVHSLCPAGPQHSLPEWEQPRHHCCPPWQLGAELSGDPGPGAMMKTRGPLPAHSSLLTHKQHKVVCLHVHKQTQVHHKTTGNHFSWITKVELWSVIVNCYNPPSDQWLQSRTCVWIFPQL